MGLPNETPAWPSPRPRRSLARRAAAPWTECSRRSGRRRRASRSARRARSSAPGRRRGTRPCSRPGPEPITTTWKSRSETRRQTGRRGRRLGSRPRAPASAPRRRSALAAAAARAPSVAGVGAVAPSALERQQQLPSDTRSPTLTRSCLDRARDGAGTSIVALSDSSVTSGSSAATSSPTATRISITGTSVKSPMSGTVGPRIAHSSARRRSRQHPDEVDHEPRGGGAVDHAVVVGERQRHHQPRHELASRSTPASSPTRVTPRIATSGALTIGVKRGAADPAQRGDRERGAAASRSGDELAVARLARQLGELARRSPSGPCCRRP